MRGKAEQYFRIVEESTSGVVLESDQPKQKGKSKYYIDIACSNCDERVVKTLDKSDDNIIKGIKCDNCGASYRLHIGGSR